MLISLANSIVWDGLAVISMIGSFLYYCWQQQWLGRDNRMTTLERDADNNWTIHSHHGDTVATLKLKNCVESSFLIILVFRSTLSWRTYSLTVMADAVDAELYRKLRLFCRDPKTFQQ